MIQGLDPIGISGSLKTPVHTKRGLPQLLEATSFEPSRLVAVFTARFAYTEIPAGIETELELGGARIPRHAEVTKLTARLELGGTPADASPMVQAARVEETGSPARSFSTTIAPPPGPSSLTLTVRGGDVIWTWSGRPGPQSFEIPDFAAQANAFLERLVEQEGAADGLVTLRLALESDIDARARLSLPDGGLAYRLVQPQGWTNEIDATVHMDRNLEVGFGETIEIPLEPIVTGDGERTVPVEELRLDVGGKVGAERLLGEVGPAATREQATVGRGFAIAQRVTLPDGLPSAACVGVALGLVLAEETEIYFELQPDAGGSPAAGKPLAGGTAVLVPPEGGGAAWHACRWPEAAELSAGAGPWWIVLKEIRGVARLGLVDGGEAYLGPLLLNRGGQFWQSPYRREAGRAATARALLRLLYLPEPDTRSAALELIAVPLGPGGTAGRAVTARVDPAADVQAVRLAFPAGTTAQALRLTARSHAEGTVALANVVQVYRPS